DLDFSQDLWSRNDASRDLALAYAIAHEVGHHVQNLLGISQEVQRIQQQVSASEAEQLWLRLELQADCFAGIWAYAAQETRQMPQAGDVEAALTASSAVGNDRLSDADLQGDRPQAAASGDVMPDTFTHGSAAQRLHWFSQGMAQGAIAQCNTFAALDP
ncbi:MAG: neutral zinc metallopeptidase, partial [Elainellaceae cyanobacterium]